MFKAAIFDMDGVLVNNHNVHLDAWEAYCAKYNLPFNRDTFAQQYFGKTNADILSALLNTTLTPAQIELMGEEKEELYRNLYKNTIEPVAGLVQLLTQLKKHSIKIGVASSAPVSNIDFVLDSLCIRQFFDTLVDGSMVTKGKPHPDIYLKAAHLLNEHPSNCIVFEDSVSGINSGKSAGMKVVALTTTHSLHQLPATNFHASNFLSISYEQLNALQSEQTHCTESNNL